MERLGFVNPDDRILCLRDANSQNEMLRGNDTGRAGVMLRGAEVVGSDLLWRNLG